MSASPETVTVILRNGGSVTIQNVIGQPVQVDVPTLRLGTPNGSTGAIAMPLTDGVQIGMRVRGVGVPPGSYVTAITPNSGITINNNTTANNPVQLQFGDGYFDADNYRDGIDAAFMGTLMDINATEFQNAVDEYNHTPPRFEQRCRTQTQFSRQDANNNPLPMRWFWSDEILGLGDGGETF